MEADGYVAEGGSLLLVNSTRTASTLVTHEWDRMHMILAVAKARDALQDAAAALERVRASAGSIEATALLDSVLVATQDGIDRLDVLGRHARGEFAAEPTGG